MDSARLRATIASAQDGSPQAYQALLSHYGPRLYGYFIRATGRHHDAEDLLGELVCRLVSRLKDYDDRGRFEPWLFRIAANMVRDRIRRQRTGPAAVSLSGDEESSGALVDRIASGQQGVEAGMELAEQTQRLRAALEKLDDKTRQMILLRHFGELSFKEIADIYECPLGTVLARVHRGLAAMRELMGSSDETD